MEFTEHQKREALLSFVFEDLKGFILSDITHEKTDCSEDEVLIFTCIDGNQFKMYHAQDCCESVYVEDICGDLQDLIGSPILLAEETSRVANDFGGSETWTYYKMETYKGGVTISWYGESNGYYNESADFTWIDPEYNSL